MVNFTYLFCFDFPHEQQQIVQELQNDKIAMIRTYYEQVVQECETLQNNHSTSKHHSDQLQDKRKLLQSLEKQLLEMTGVPVETQVTAHSVWSNSGYLM